MMRCWFLRWICVGPDCVVDRHQVLGRQHLPCALLHQHVAPRRSTCWRSSSRSRTMIGYSLPSWRNSAACVPATLVRIVFATLRHGQAEQRGLRAIDAHRELRPAFVAADARVGDPGRRCRSGPSPPGRPAASRSRSLAADFERRAGRRRCCRPREPVDLVVAADGVRADDHARDAGQLPPQLHRDLFARSLPLVLRRQQQLHVAAVDAAAAGPEPPAAAAAAA